jgi:methylated-DNA-protein-cysteine methyltransferase related protein
MSRPKTKKPTPSPKDRIVKPAKGIAVTVAKDKTASSSFFADVHDVARQIPKGRVTSYGAIAAYLGSRLSARMVGWAMNGAHKAKPKVPAHRVVNSKGLLSGKMHFETPDRMQELLQKEGTLVENDQVKDFAGRFWDPVKELAL